MLHLFAFIDSQIPVPYNGITEAGHILYIINMRMSIETFCVCRHSAAAASFTYTTSGGSGEAPEKSLDSDGQFRYRCTRQWTVKTIFTCRSQ